MYLAAMLQVEVGKFIGEHARKAFKGSQPWTLLMCAASQGHTRAVELLLAAGGSLAISPQLSQ